MRDLASISAEGLGRIRQVRSIKVAHHNNTTAEEVAQPANITRVRSMGYYLGY